MPTKIRKVKRRRRTGVGRVPPPPVFNAPERTAEDVASVEAFAAFEARFREAAEAYWREVDEWTAHGSAVLGVSATDLGMELLLFWRPWPPTWLTAAQRDLCEPSADPRREAPT